MNTGNRDSEITNDTSEQVAGMKVDIEDVSSCKKILRVEIPPEDVNAEFEKAYEEVRTTLPVRGFRKGRAPRSVLRMRFGKYVKGEVIENLIPPAFEKALEDAKLEILRPLDTLNMNPPIDELSVKENEPLIFEVTFDVKPEIIIPDLTQLEVEKGDVNVAKEDVDNFLNELREERANFVPVEDRPAQEGDYVTLSIMATSDGEVLEDQKEQVFEIGENMPIPELAQHLVGMEAEEEKEFLISFPADDSDVGRMPALPEWAKHLAGKEAKFRVNLHKITEKHLPPLDDDFAKDLGEDDLQHLTANTWNELVESRRRDQWDKQKKDLLSQLLEKSEFEVPEFLVEEQTKNEMRSKGQQPGAAETEVSEEELSQYRSSALDTIRKIWIFDEIARREEVDVSNEEIEAEVGKLAGRLNRDPQKYMKLLEDTKRIEGIKAAIWENKIFNILIEKASPKRALIV